MAVKVFVNVSLVHKNDLKGLVDKIQGLPHVDRVLTASKSPELYISPHAPKDFVPNPPPIDLIVYISARSCRQAMQTVLDIRNISDQIKSTVTSLALAEQKATRVQATTTKAARGKK